MPWSDFPLTSLTLPQDGAPDDAAIQLIGRDELPPCMQADYSAAIMFRPKGNISLDVPYWFIAQRAVSVGVVNQVDEGWLQYDADASLCRFWITHRRNGFLSGTNFRADYTYGDLAHPAGFTTSPTMGFENGTFVRIDDLSSFQCEGPASFGPFDVSISSNIDWGGSISVPGIDNGSFASSSTSYTTSGGALSGVGFVCPPSGSFYLHHGGRMSNSGSGASSFLSFQLNSGTQIVGGGTPVYGNLDADAAEWGAPANYTGRMMVTRYINATPGAEYNAFQVHRCQSGTSTYSYRHMFFQPAF